MIPRPPVYLDRVFDDPAAILGLYARHAPYPMLQSHPRLIDAYRIPVATAVPWFFNGSGGRFAYWPEAPDAPPAQVYADAYRIVPSRHPDEALAS